MVVPVNTFATPDELDYVLRHSDAAWLLLQPRVLKHAFLDDLRARHPEVAEAKPGAIRCAALPQLRGVVALGPDWDALRAAGADVPDALLDAISAEIHPADEALVIYTSGTTARPKGVAHRQRTPVIQTWRFAELMGFDADERVYTAYPFFWTAGIAMSLGATLAAGGTLLLQETFEPGAALALAARRAGDLAPGLAAPVEGDGGASRRRAHGPVERPQDRVQLAAREARRPREGRLGHLRLLRHVGDLHARDRALGGRAGRASQGHQRAGRCRAWSCASSTRRRALVLPPGEKGEIAVKGVTLMSRLRKIEPELYLDADGFFHTQDGGYLDAAGDLHWTGRLSNLIKTGGANVSPLEIEERAARYTGVRSAHAVGVPHPTLGEAIVLCVVPTAGAAVDVPSLEQFLRETLSAYKLPRAVFVLRPEEVSYTGTQKVQVDPLRELAHAKLCERGAVIAGHRYGR